MKPAFFCNVMSCNPVDIYQYQGPKKGRAAVRRANIYEALGCFWNKLVNSGFYT